MEELFDVFDINGNHLGIKPKSFCHSQNPGVYHKPVWIWILNNKGQILLQKRAETKKWLPNKWDSSATGHVSAGETMLQGCQREVLEELGINTKEDEFEFWGEYLAETVWELGQVYKLENNFETTQMKMQVEEVSEIKWFDFDDFVKLFYSDDFVPYDKEYKDMIVERLQSHFKRTQTPEESQISQN